MELPSKELFSAVTGVVIASNGMASDGYSFDVATLYSETAALTRARGLFAGFSGARRACFSV